MGKKVPRVAQLEAPVLPTGKGMGLLPDGDMLESIWKGIQARGTHAQRLSKVKGHATFEDVDTGKSTTEERLGNNEADACATLGIHEATPGPMRRIACWLLRRQSLYGQWLVNVNKVIIAVLRAENAKRSQT